MIPYGKQHITTEDEKALVSALHSDFLTTGPNVSFFEEKLANYTGTKHVIACANATCGLHLACVALGLGKGDLVITSPITFLASANCAEFCGAQVDFVDIDPQTLCISSEALKEYCLTKAVPKAVIHVSFAGFVGDLPKIYELSREFGFKVIEDAAHSLGSSYHYQGQNYKSGSCTHSDLAVFSFHPVKNITTGEGGAVLSNSDLYATKVRLARGHGMTREIDLSSDLKGPWYYEMHELGFNYRITDLQCALGISQLSRIDQIKKCRAEISQRYTEELSSCEELIFPALTKSESDICQHIYVLQIKAGAKKRKQLYLHLMQKGIATQIHYIPVYWQPYYKNKYSYDFGKCPFAEEYYSQTISLPLYVGLKSEEQDYIIKEIKNFFS